jgi:drug/metabolite transporter (DMT)-like permease
MFLIGESAALVAAFSWALASQLYSNVGKKFPSVWLNLFKNSLALLILIPVGFITLNKFTGFNKLSVTVLFLSGVVGIGIGDSAFLACVKRIGARRALVLETFCPIVGAFLAFIFLAETLKVSQMLWAVLTLAGILLVILEENKSEDKSFSWKGYAFGVIALLCQSGGAVMTRGILAGSQISPLWSGCVRLGAGLIVVIVWIIFSKNRWNKSLLDAFKSSYGKLTIACIFGTVMGLWLQQISLKYAATGIAQTLSSTSPIFVLPIAFFYGEKITLRAIAGALLATIGAVGLILFI